MEKPSAAKTSLQRAARTRHYNLRYTINLGSASRPLPDASYTCQALQAEPQGNDYSGDAEDTDMWYSQRSESSILVEPLIAKERAKACSNPDFV